MPGFEGRLAESERWDVINVIRALGAAADAPSIGRQVDPERPWLIAPDFTVSVGPLAPGALRDYRGRRIVLVVLYTLPESGPRLADLARSYNLLWIMGVEVIAVPTDATPDAIRDLGALAPPALFPVVSDGAAAIVETYGLFAPGAHAELLIDRQGYLRAIWSGEAKGLPPPAALSRQVELLNAEKNVPPFPDDHVH
jgi:putative copper resistance protein D